MKLKKGKWSPSQKIKGKEVLLVASGSQAKDYTQEINIKMTKVEHQTKL